MTVKFGDSTDAPLVETSLSSFSRSTRRSLAYDCSFTANTATECWQLKNSKHGSFLFMKDHWREEGMRTKTKGSFQWSCYASGDHACFRLQNPLQCHRIFLDTIACDLRAFGNCRVLVNCIADAMEAVQCAFNYARILPQEISCGNMMITPAHRGLLIDWDLCLPEGLTHRSGCTGTWQFMSISLLQGGNETQESVVHTLDDDKESAFWVLVNIALRYLKHPLHPTTLYRMLTDLFDYMVLDRFGRPIGGYQKDLMLARCAKDSCHLEKFEVPGFNNLLTELAGLLFVRYEQPSAEALARYEARLAKWGEVGIDEQTPVAIYKARLERLANPNWFHETLRRHAENIPLPSARRRATSSSSRPRKAGPSTRKRARKGTSSTTIYDFHQNEFYSLDQALDGDDE